MGREEEGAEVRLGITTVGYSDALERFLKVLEARLLEKQLWIKKIGPKTNAISASFFFRSQRNGHNIKHFYSSYKIIRYHPTGCSTT